MMKAMNYCTTYQATIYIAGDLQTIRSTCRKFCEIGFCVTVTPTEYIYTGGAETGAIVGIINYARFPKEHEEIRIRAHELANDLMTACSQKSCSLVFPEDTAMLNNPKLPPKE